MTMFYAGQLLCGGFQGTSVTPQAYHLIVEHRVSTMILSRKNAISVEQMSKLIRDLQYIAMTQGRYKHPLMFAIDEEGGMSNALFDPDFVTQYPCAMGLAATGDPKLVYEILKAVAIELKKIGFSIILGPVLDVVTKFSHQLVGVRSFGTTIEDVTKYGRMCAKGLQDGGLFTVGKHFPGIGNAAVDSLLELPMIGDSLDQLRHFNVRPFANLIEEDLLDGVSAAGCGVPNISPDETHACLSPIVLNQLLREELKFDGLILSECLEMETLYHSFGLEQGVILALNAGCDLVMVCHDWELQNQAIESIKKAIINFPSDTLLSSFRRIEKLQERLPSWSEVFPEGEHSAKQPPTLFKYEFPEQWQEHQKLSSLAYKKSITLVRDFSGALPISNYLTSSEERDSILLLTPFIDPTYPCETVDKSNGRLHKGEEVFQKFGEFLSDHPIRKTKPYNVLHTTYTANGLTQLHESLIEQSKVVIVVTSEASRHMHQIGVVKYVSLLCGANPASLNRNITKGVPPASTKPLIIVATQSPYDFFYNKTIGSAYLCCYDYTNSAFSKLTEVLMGDYEPEGCVPGEKKFLLRIKAEQPNRTNNTPRRRWLVDELDWQRDGESITKLFRSNFDRGNSKIDYEDSKFYKRLSGLLATTKRTQKSFVVRNSSLNIVLGFILTYVAEVQGVKSGRIIMLLVDKSKRYQNIGKSLHSRAMKYFKEANCSQVYLGSCGLPLIHLDDISSAATSFFTSVGWNIERSAKRYIMVLDQWDDAPEITDDNYIFDKNADKILARDLLTHEIVGSVTTFTSDSQLSKYFPFIDSICNGKGVIGGLIWFTGDSRVKNGLVSSAITYFGSSVDAIMTIESDYSLQQLGFREWAWYYDHYGKRDV
ncbi:Beta-hexosaminidase [Candida viswanathii]|uniref:Beta-hexosaminidase n=1 Tax=Candida viswanathii TaxID=5486 RepID=A0A367Y977_9ASCO|nr:Beta-hexosaminidase [Candida viswanathii]